MLGVHALCQRVLVAFDGGERWVQLKGGIPVIAVDNLASRLGEIANRFYGRPSEQLEVIGVTGTAGKSTTAAMTRSS